MKAAAETQASATPHPNDPTTSTDAPRSQAAASPDAQLPKVASAEPPLTSAMGQPVRRSEVEPAPPRGLTEASSGSPSQGAGSPTLQHRSSDHVITRPSSDSGDSTESGSSDNESIDYQPVGYRKAGRLQQKRDKAQHLIFGDSTIKYIDNDRYMGRSPSFIQRTSTTSVALDVIHNWSKNDTVQTAVLHVGVNGVRDDPDATIIADKIKSCLDSMSESFPRADIGFSEILLIGRENHQSSKNKTVIDINARVRDYCQDNGYVYVKHSKLQSPAARSLFDDEVHISNSEGTAVLVSDIQRTLRDRRPPAQDTQPGSTRVFYNRQMRRPNGRRQNYQNVTRENSQHQDMDMNNMIKLLTINMLSNLGFVQWFDSLFSTCLTNKYYAVLCYVWRMTWRGCQGCGVEATSLDIALDRRPYPRCAEAHLNSQSMYMLWNYTWCLFGFFCFFLCVHAFDMYEKAYVNEEPYTYVCIHRYVWLYMDVYAGICSCEWGTYIFPFYLQYVK